MTRSDRLTFHADTLTTVRVVDRPMRRHNHLTSRVRHTIRRIYHDAIRRCLFSVSHPLSSHSCIQVAAAVRFKQINYANSRPALDILFALQQFRVRRKCAWMLLEPSKLMGDIRKTVVFCAVKYCDVAFWKAITNSTPIYFLWMQISYYWLNEAGKIELLQRKIGSIVRS